PAMATGALVALLREHVAGPGPDRFLAPELAEAERLLMDDRPTEALATVGVTLDQE
ncbi:MAG: histidine ammonia-lyase, partial [Acidimicrobiia bacterium]|nr:histidine ammonia-lyase [Acidimicrobiia bacterium]